MSGEKKLDVVFRALERRDNISQIIKNIPMDGCLAESIELMLDNNITNIEDLTDDYYDLSSFQELMKSAGINVVVSRYLLEKFDIVRYTLIDRLQPNDLVIAISLTPQSKSSLNQTKKRVIRKQGKIITITDEDTWEDGELSLYVGNKYKLDRYLRRIVVNILMYILGSIIKDVKVGPEDC